MVDNVAYLPKLYIRHYCYGKIVIFKNSRISDKILKTEGMGENKIAYMKHIKIQSCHMGVIFTPNNMTQQRQKCVHTHSHIMRYHTGNLYFGVVPDVQSLIFLTRK